MFAGRVCKVTFWNKLSVFFAKAFEYTTMATAIRGEEELTNTYFNKRESSGIITIALPFLGGDPGLVSTTWSAC